MPHPVNSKIRELLTNKGISQRAIAEELNVSQGAINQRLNSKVPFNIDDIVIIAKMFKIRVEDIMEDVLDYTPEDGGDRVTASDFVIFRREHFRKLDTITEILTKINESIEKLIK